MNPLMTDDGLALQGHDWASEHPRGRVLIVHGLGEHMDRYAPLAAALNGAGWQVQGWDLRGHGGSAGKRGDTPDPEAMLRDIARMLDAMRPGPGPRVLLGHSMGGALAARFVAESLAAQPAAWSRPVDALVLSSPALDANLSGAQRTALALAERLAPGLAVNNGLKTAWISRDPAVVRAYEDDRLVHDRITARLTRTILDAGRIALEAAPRWATPTLLMWAGADRCVAPRGSAAFAAAAPAQALTPRVWPELFHEIFNEPERDAVIAELLAWLQPRLPA